MDNIKLELPKNLRAITLTEYQKYSKIVTANPDASQEFLEIKIMEIFCGLKYKDIEGLPVGIFDDAISWVMTLLTQKTPLVKRFKMVGSDGVEVEFGFIPNLDAMTMGEYIDLNNYLNSAEDLSKAMAVLYRPIHPSFEGKENYRISSYEGTSKYGEIMKDMPLDVALGAKVFFYRLGNKLSSHILNSFQQHSLLGATLSEEEKIVLTKNMLGIKNYMLSQEEMHYKSMQLR